MIVYDATFTITASWPSVKHVPTYSPIMTYWSPAPSLMHVHLDNSLKYFFLINAKIKIKNGFFLWYEMLVCPNLFMRQLKVKMLVFRTYLVISTLLIIICFEWNYLTQRSLQLQMKFYSILILKSESLKYIVFTI